MLKISTKITLFYLVATASIIILMAFSMYYIYYIQRLQAIDSELQGYTAFLTSNMVLEESNLSHVFGVLNEKKAYSKAKLSSNYQFVLTDNDSIIYESNNTIVLDSLISPIIEMDHLSKRPGFSSVVYSNVHYRTYSTIINSSENTKLELILITSLEKFYESLNLLKYIFFVVCPGLIILAAIIGSIIAKKSFVPVMQIIEATKIITAENLDKRVPVGNSNDELTYLARTLNDMIDRLNKTFKSQKQFIADASHDFRTPLTVMRLEFEIMLSKLDLNSDMKSVISKSLQEVKRLSNLADNLLILAEADSNQLIMNMEEFRIDELLMEVIGNFNILSSNKKVTFRVNIENDYEILADIGMIKRVLNNLFDNAVKYSIPNTIIDVNLFVKNNYLNLEIINQSEPFPADFELVIFDRFQRSQHSRTAEGFGLGLPIVKSIIDGHKGIIDFEIKQNVFKISIRLKKL